MIKFFVDHLDVRTGLSPVLSILLSREPLDAGYGRRTQPPARSLGYYRRVDGMESGVKPDALSRPVDPMLNTYTSVTEIDCFTLARQFSRYQENNFISLFGSTRIISKAL